MVEQVGFILKEKVASLQDALLTKHPRLPTLLHEIHECLKTYPEQVTLLAPEEICTIVNGLQKQTGVEFALAAQKGSGTKNAVAKIKNLGADAF